MPVIERDGARIAYAIEGADVGAGAPVVVLAHNLLCDRAVFDAQCASWRERARLIRPDFRGHGESGPCRRPFAIRDLAADLVAILDREGVERARFVGLSLGASAALEVALAHPARVERMALLGATGRASARADAWKNGALALLFHLLGPRRWLVAQALPILFGRSFQAEDAATVRAWGERIGRLDGASARRAVGAWSGRPALLGRLGACAMPALVVAGAEDVACPPAEAAALAAALPGARLVEVPAAGHMLPVERPSAVTAALDAFLW